MAFFPEGGCLEDLGVCSSTSYINKALKVILSTSLCLWCQGGRGCGCERIACISYHFVIHSLITAHLFFMRLVPSSCGVNLFVFSF